MQNDFLLHISIVRLQLRWSRRKNPSTYLSGYASGLFVVSASFRQNSQNVHDGTFFHHPARWCLGVSTRSLQQIAEVLPGQHFLVAQE